MIKIKSNNLRTPIQQIIAEVRKAISNKMASVQYKSISDAKGFCEVQITVTYNGTQHDFAGRHMIRDTKMGAYDAAELSALTLAMDFLDLEYTFVSPEEKPVISELPKTWTRKMVLDYHGKGVEILLHDMMRDNVDVEQILMFKDSLPPNQRLTVQKIADRFFPTSTSVTSANTIVTPEKPAPVSRLKNIRDNWVDLLADFNGNMIDEDKFKQLNIDGYSGLIDFCKYAPDSLINQIAEASAV